MRVLFVVQYSGDENLGIMIMSKMLKQKGFQVEMVEAQYKDICVKLRQNNANTVLAYSAPTVFINYYLELNKQIKKVFKVFSVFGGPHPTAVPELIENEGVDGVCIGEGEFALLELIEKLSSGQSIRDIKNWWIKENGTIYKNSLRPLVKNLDNLPFADRDLFRKQRLFDPEKIHIIAGRGCPYSCSYCCHSYYNKLYSDNAGVIRKRSVENVIKEILQFQEKFPLKFVIFDDDIFTLPDEWIKEFSPQYKKLIRRPFFCYIRADLINREIVEELKSAGCYSVSLGIETDDDLLRSTILKKNISKKQIISAMQLIKKYKIKLKTSNIIGIPGGTLNNDLNTIRLNNECRVDYASVGKLKRYPGTEISKIFFSAADRNPSRLDSKDESRERQLENLEKLFPLAVEYPFLIHFLKILIKLPLIRFYTFCHILWEGYCAYFRLYPAGRRGFFRGIKKYLYLLKCQFENKIGS